MLAPPIATGAIATGTQGLPHHLPLLRRQHATHTPNEDDNTHQYGNLDFMKLGSIMMWRPLDILWASSSHPS